MAVLWAASAAQACGLFEASGDTLSFTAERILADGDQSVIEFEIALGGDVLKGVDMITWRDGKMVSMRAHLTKTG
ncbi:MAG: nuclear transport factor 2 family protein [Cyanobacteria bacterium J06638_7]